MSIQAEALRQLIRNLSAQGVVLSGEDLNVVQGAANKLESLEQDKAEMIQQIVDFKNYCTEIEAKLEAKSTSVPSVGEKS